MTESHTHTDTHKSIDQYISCGYYTVDWRCWFLEAMQIRFIRPKLQLLVIAVRFLGGTCCAV